MAEKPEIEWWDAAIERAAEALREKIDEEILSELKKESKRWIRQQQWAIERAQGVDLHRRRDMPPVHPGDCGTVHSKTHHLQGEGMERKRLGNIDPRCRNPECEKYGKLLPRVRCFGKRIMEEGIEEIVCRGPDPLHPNYDEYEGYKDLEGEEFEILPLKCPWCGWEHGEIKCPGCGWKCVMELGEDGVFFCPNCKGEWH